MKGKVESTSASTPPNGALMLGPALQHSQRVPLAGLPFLGLGGRWQRQAQDAVPGRHNAPPTTWPAPRWVNWPERDGAPPVAHAAEVAQQTSPTRPAAEPHPQDLQTLASLAPALNWAARRAVAQTRIQGDARSVPAPSSPVWSSSGRLDPALVGILSLAHAQLTNTLSTRSDFTSQPGLSWRDAAEFLGDATGSAVPTAQWSPGQAARPVTAAQSPAAGTTRNPGAPVRASADHVPSGVETLPHPVAPPWSLLNVLPGVISRAVPPGHTRVAAPSLTPREVSILGLPVDETPDRREPGPYAPTHLQELTAVTSTIEHLVERRVTSEVKRQREEMESQARRRDRAENEHKTLDVTSDEIVRVLLKKMQALSQQERFRLGRLR